MIKPDGMKVSIANEINKTILSSVFELYKKKKVWISKTLAKELYKEHEKKIFYKELCDFISSSPG